jgi:hypothetical protein
VVRVEDGRVTVTSHEQAVRRAQELIARRISPDADLQEELRRRREDQTFA